MRFYVEFASVNKKSETYFYANIPTKSNLSTYKHRHHNIKAYQIAIDAMVVFYSLFQITRHVSRQI
jgi:hypothetical protein